MEVDHFSHNHPLIFAEKLENEDKKEVVCSGCEEPISGPGYKCSGCNFSLHKSCIELPSKIQHRLHPIHTLTLQAPKNSSCDACRKDCSRCFFYRCVGCNFNLDIKCVSRWQINNNDCQHAFIAILEQIQFSCQVCGEEGKGIAYLCTICRLLVHHKCATAFQRTIHSSAHEHLLTLTYSLHDQDTDSKKVFCRLCYKKVNTKYAIYYCKECRYIVHLNCPSSIGRRIHKKIKLAIMGRRKQYRLTDSAIKEVGDERAPSSQEMIKHFSHDQHNLILSDEKLEDDKLCEGCMQFISSPFYSCLRCNFYLHERCAKLATMIERHPLHEHPLTLLPNEAVFCCDACNHIRQGFFYICDKCPNYSLDIQCCSIPEIFKHKGHEHLLYLALSSEEKCYACDRKHESQGVFVCTDCEFALGFECATLPLVAQHEYHTHFLQLTYTAEDCFKEYYCLICEEKRDPNHWFYYCAQCDFPAHPQCVLGKYPYIKIGRALANTVHKHPIAFVQKIKHSPPCGVCGEHLNDKALECTECKLIGHITCCATKFHTESFALPMPPGRVGLSMIIPQSIILQVEEFMRSRPSSIHLSSVGLNKKIKTIKK